MEPQLVAEFVRLGVPPEQLPKEPAAASVPARPAGPLLARHLDGAVRLAMALRTQKRAVARMGGVLYLGLDYARLDATKRDLRLPMRGQRSLRLFNQFKVCENEMLRVWNTREPDAVPQGGQR